MRIKLGWFRVRETRYFLRDGFSRFYLKRPAEPTSPLRTGQVVTFDLHPDVFAPIARVGEGFIDIPDGDHWQKAKWRDLYVDGQLLAHPLWVIRPEQ